MFCPFLDFMLKKTIKPMFLLSALLFVLGVQVCFGQPTPQLAPQVINNDLVVTKTLRVGMSPNALTIGPRAKLQVGGLIGSGGLRIGPWPANPDNYVFFGVSTLNQSDSINYALLQDFAGKDKGRTFLNSPVDIRFRIKNSDEMMLSNKGNVGIGTTEPSQKLAVVGDCISLRNSTSGDINRIQMCTHTSPQTSGPIDETKNSLISNKKLVIGSSNYILLRPAHEAGVAIGNSVGFPPNKLTVYGDIGVSEVNVWDGNDDYDLTWNGFAISREGSSRRYKRDIAPLKEDFHKIFSLEPKQFKMKDGFGNKDEWLFGYIAEDLDKLGLTKLVNYDKEKRPDGIKYKKIAIYVLEVVKEQQSKIKQLEVRLEKQTTESSATKAKNEKLKEDLLVFGARLDAIEATFLARSALPKEKPAKVAGKQKTVH